MESSAYGASISGPDLSVLIPQGTGSQLQIQTVMMLYQFFFSLNLIPRDHNQTPQTQRKLHIYCSVLTVHLTPSWVTWCLLVCQATWQSLTKTQHFNSRGAGTVWVALFKHQESANQVALDPFVWIGHFSNPVRGSLRKKGLRTGHAHAHKH